MKEQERKQIMEQEELKKECLEYFRARQVYQKLFEGMRKKYAGLGRLGGTVTLTGLTREERQQLGGFFQKDYTENKTVTISGRLMEKALSSSRFAGISWEDILEAYFGQPLEVTKEQKIQADKEREAFFRDFLEKRQEDRGKHWLESTLREHGRGYSLLLQQYRENPEELKKLLENVLDAIEKLPALSQEQEILSGRPELLPVFAAKITGDPHYFDQGTAGERLLLDFLESSLEKEKREPGADRQSLSAAEYKKKLFYEAGILKDELSNDVLVYGIRGRRKNGKLHQGIQGFYEAREPLKLTLQTLGCLGEIRGPEGIPVYVVENPAVFSVLSQKYPENTFICGNGQVNLAVLVLMDKLAERHSFYYAGDFDPEGLLIAQRLKLRYKDRLSLWNYRKELYEKYHSTVELSSERLKKLENIKAEELQEIKEILKRKKQAAYQETMLEEFWLPEKRGDH